VLGATGSRLLSGTLAPHVALESRLAAHFCAESALFFNSGWDANVSFSSTVPQPTEWVICDEYVHASVHSGLRASRVPPNQMVPFVYNDPTALAAVLEKVMARANKQSTQPPTIFLAVESLYSMDGDFGSLSELADVKDAYVPRAQQCIVVDEAHSTGVYSAGGRGLTFAAGEATNLGNNRGRVTVRLMTFGKGVGCSGAALLCGETVRTFIINFARPFIFSTAPPLKTVLALDVAWDVLASTQGDAKRADLLRTIANFRARLTPILASAPAHILRLPDENFADQLSPIVPLLTPTPVALSAFLLKRGFVVFPFVPPAVPHGAERICMRLRAGMDSAVVDKLVEALAEWVARATTPIRAKL